MSKDEQDATPFMAPTDGASSLPDPLRRLTRICVTGTNGKTSTALWCAALLNESGGPAMAATTVGVRVGAEWISGPPTQEDFARGFVQTGRAGGKYAVIEATSKALRLGFAKQIKSDVGVFTNLSHDHLDDHGSAEDYLASKAQLFVHLLPGGTAIFNAADLTAPLLLEITPAHCAKRGYRARWRGEAQIDAELVADDPKQTVDGIQFSLQWRLPGGTLRAKPKLPMIGDFWVENLLAALLAAHAAGGDPRTLLSRIGRLEGPPGRMELVHQEPSVFIDYAHTPEALQRAIAAARSVCHGRLHLVFGAGGDRDREKRPLMGAEASAADAIWLTSDNPRSEAPEAIISDIRRGIAGDTIVEQEPDRAIAIRSSCAQADSKDVVLIAGKGHETTQTSHAGTNLFSDKEIVQALFASA